MATSVRLAYVLIILDWNQEVQEEIKVIFSDPIMGEWLLRSIPSRQFLLNKVVEGALTLLEIVYSFILFFMLRVLNH